MADEGFSAEQGVFDPLAEYKNHYKKLHEQNIAKLFAEVRKKAQTDVSLNQQTIKKLVAAQKANQKTTDKLKKQKLLKTFAIVFLVILFITAAIFVYLLTQKAEFWLFIALAISVALIPLCFMLIFKIKPKIKLLNEQSESEKKRISELTNSAWHQMRSLNDLLVPELRNQLMAKTIPMINLDKAFNRNRLDYLTRNFGLPQTDSADRSALYVQSGEIDGNPFFICKDLAHKLGLQTYRGSITIHWTTTSIQNGKRVMHRHTQVLTATVQKPRPFYNEISYLVYGNEAAPDLIFSRTGSGAEKMTQKQIDKTVDKKIKKLNKKAEKSVTKGKSYTVLGNHEFEVLFGATDRNNEVQFRLLFTPFAQKNLLKLMKDKDYGFGDDFDIKKQGKINLFYPRQLSRLNLNIPENFFHGYDFDDVERRFSEHNKAYFRHLYFAFAPLMSVPLYRQQKPHEYIYKGLYDSNLSFYAHEFVANSFGAGRFGHPQSNTKNILKTKVLSYSDNSDTVAVTAFGYRTRNRVDFVSKLGGDGRLHAVPVHWTEYIPVEQTTNLEINIFSDEEEQLNKYQQFRKEMEKDPKKTALKVGRFIARIQR